MSKTWKWILGIFLVAVIVAAFASVGYMWRRHSFEVASYRSLPFDGQPGGPFHRDGNGPKPGRGNDTWEHPRMYERGDNWNYHGMYGGTLVPYHSGFFMLGGLVKTVLFGGLLYGAYWLGRRNARIVLDPKAGAPVAEVSSAEAESPVPAPEAESPPTPRKRGRKVSDQ